MYMVVDNMYGYYTRWIAETLRYNMSIIAQSITFYIFMSFKNNITIQWLHFEQSKTFAEQTSQINFWHLPQLSKLRPALLQM